MHIFKKPELDEQIRTALVELGEAEGALRYYTGERRSLQDVYDAVGTSITRAAEGMLSENLATLTEQVETARAAVENWNNILDVLRKKTA